MNKSQGFAATLTRCLLHNTIAVLVLACLVAYAHTTIVRQGRRRPEAEGTPAALVQANDCWTGAPPAGKEAARVVVTVDNVTRVAGRRMTERAIEQAVFGVDHGLTVHGFCPAVAA